MLSARVAWLPVGSSVSQGRKIMTFTGKNATVAGILALTLATAALGDANAPTSPKVSSFAPADDLLQQVDFFIGRVDESLADPAAFDAAKQSRTFKDGNTLAVLALALSLSDEDFPQKRSMPALLKAAHELAAADKSAERARTALQAVKAARAGEAREAKRRNGRKRLRWGR